MEKYKINFTGFHRYCTMAFGLIDNYIAKGITYEEAREIITLLRKLNIDIDSFGIDMDSDEYTEYVELKERLVHNLEYITLLERAL